jgi:hypothetical protein
MLRYFYLLFLIGLLNGCKKDNTPPPAPPTVSFTLSSLKINEIVTNNPLVYNVNPNPIIKISFSAPVDKASVSGNILFNQTPCNTCRQRRTNGILVGIALPKVNIYNGSPQLPIT